jgi:hypothetical protein
VPRRRMPRHGRSHAARYPPAQTCAVR